MSFARTFLAGIIDYAGLFPPASLDMKQAVRSYGEYRKGADRDLLGRFVLPAARLAEFSEAAETILHRDEEPWRVSLIASADLSHARESALHFNCSHWKSSPLGHTVCDAIEIPVRSSVEVAQAAAAFPDFFELFLEVPAAEDPRPLLDAIAGTRAAAKIRTGGITAEAVPSAAELLRFLRACHQRSVRFKATAGLHHALRGSYPLTYEPNAERATMFGYLNLFLAAAFIEAGLSDDEILGILEETDASSLIFDEAGVSWRDNRVGPEVLQLTRERLALSFGSCSFAEPVNEAGALGII